MFIFESLGVLFSLFSVATIIGGAVNVLLALGFIYLSTRVILKAYEHSKK